MRDHRPSQAAGPLTCQVAVRRARGVLRSDDGMTPHFQMGSRRRTRATAPFQSCQSLSLYCSSSAAPPKTDPRSPGAACTVSGSGSRTALGIARCGLVQSRALSTHPTVTDLQYRYPQTQAKETFANSILSAFTKVPSVYSRVLEHSPRSTVCPHGGLQMLQSTSNSPLGRTAPTRRSLSRYSCL